MGGRVWNVDFFSSCGRLDGEHALLWKLKEGQGLAACRSQPAWTGQYGRGWHLEAGSPPSTDRSRQAEAARLLNVPSAYHTQKLPLPAPAALITGGRCRPQRPWGSNYPHTKTYPPAHPPTHPAPHPQRAFDVATGLSSEEEEEGGEDSGCVSGGAAAAGGAGAGVGATAAPNGAAAAAAAAQAGGGGKGGGSGQKGGDGGGQKGGSSGKAGGGGGGAAGLLPARDYVGDALAKKARRQRRKKAKLKAKAAAAAGAGAGS